MHAGELGSFPEQLGETSRAAGGASLPEKGEPVRARRAGAFVGIVAEGLHRHELSLPTL